MPNLAQTATPYNDCDFLAGDVVVLKELDLLCVKDLITLNRFDGEFWETDHRIGRVSEKVIRSASPAELKAKHRLDPLTRQALDKKRCDDDSQLMSQVAGIPR